MDLFIVYWNILNFILVITFAYFAYFLPKQRAQDNDFVGYPKWDTLDIYGTQYANGDSCRISIANWKFILSFVYLVPSTHQMPSGD